jgi:hypothetical protein
MRELWWEPHRRGPISRWLSTREPELWRAAREVQLLPVCAAEEQGVRRAEDPDAAPSSSVGSIRIELPGSVRSVWKVTSSLRWCVLCSRVCARYCASGRNTDLDRSRCDRPASWLPWAQCSGGDGARTAATLRSCVRLPWPPRRYFEGLWFDGDGLCLLTK